MEWEDNPGKMEHKTFDQALSGPNADYPLTWSIGINDNSVYHPILSYIPCVSTFMVRPYKTKTKIRVMKQNNLWIKISFNKYEKVNALSTIYFKFTLNLGVR